MTIDKINFWTPIQYGKYATSPAHRILEWVDSYFDTKRTVAVVVPGMMQGQSTGVKLLKESHPLWLTILKVASYATVIIPALLLCFKCALRLKFPFHLCERTLPDGTVEKGAFVNGELQQGIRIENGKAFFIAPKLLTEDSLAGFEDGLEIHFAEAMIDGKIEMILIERKIGENAFEASDDSPYGILLEMASIDTDIVAFLLEQPSNHVMTLQGLVQYLIQPNEEGLPLIYYIEIDTVVEVLALVQKNNTPIDAPILEGLFSRWAGHGQMDLMRSLLAMCPEIIQQRLYPTSALTTALLNGNHEEATLFLKTMEQQNIDISQMEKLLCNVALHESDFTEDDLRRFPYVNLREVFQVANVFINKACIETMRQIFPAAPLTPPRRSSLFSPYMDATMVEHTLHDFLVELRERDQLLTREQFEQLDQTEYLYKDSCTGYLLVQKRLEQLFFAQELIKIRNHVAVIKTPSDVLKFDVGPWKDMCLFSSDLEIYAEKITPIDRKATREEIIALLQSLCYCGIHLAHNGNLMIGKNERGEEGIFLMDIDQMQLSDIPCVPSLESLIALVPPEDHEWLNEEIMAAEQFYAPIRSELENVAHQYYRIMQPAAMMHGFGLLRTFKFPIEDLIKG